MKNLFVKALFLDIGGVLLTNGWDQKLREKIAKQYEIPLEEIMERHPHFFDLFERDRISFDDYLNKVIFFTKRSCSLEEVKKTIFESARSYDDMITFIKTIKGEYGLRVIALSNEGRELALDRIRRFDLTSFIDFFLISSFVHLKKPDPALYRMAIESVGLPLSDIVYIDDRKILIDSARECGLQGIWHQNLDETKKLLSVRLNH